LTVIVDEVSARAAEKVEAAGGSVEAGGDEEWEEE
jgi:ribosomal protein L15